MDLDFTTDQLELRASVRAVLEKECPTDLVRKVVESGLPTDELWATMVELDWPALAIPEPDGGIGLGFVDLSVVVEELGRVIAPGPLLPTTTQFAPAVAETATADQRKSLLGRVAAGDLTGSLAVAEESGSWDPSSIRAVVRPDNAGWVLEGTKRHVIEGDAVDELAVAARLPGTSGDEGITVVVVPVEATQVLPVAALDGSRRIASVVMRGTRVVKERILGGPGTAAPGLRRAIETATVALAVETVGTCQSILDIAVDHARSRHQFGVPIGSFQAMKHKFADMLVVLERARAACYFAAAAIAEDHERRSMAVSMAKAAAGDCQRHVAQEGIQALGGIGYTWEHDMHLYVKRAKSSEPLFGSAALHRERVAALLGMPGPAEPAERATAAEAEEASVPG